MTDPVARLKVSVALRLLAFGALLLFVACGGEKQPAGLSDTTQRVIASIVISPASVALDRWGDAQALVVNGLDAQGLVVRPVSATWTSSNPTVADVDSEGIVSSWLAGDAILTASITPSEPGLPSSVTVPVAVAIQRNPMCQVPTEFPEKPPVAPPPNWVVQDYGPDVHPLGAGQFLTLDLDLDGDPDVLAAYACCNHSADPQVFDFRALLNQGGGVLVDETDLILGAEEIRTIGWPAVLYRDFDLDGVEDVFVVTVGNEFSCGLGGEACVGLPANLLMPKAGTVLRDYAPTNLSPYEPFTRSSGSDAADVDCDGDDDVFLGDWSSDIEVPTHLFINGGDGFFVAEDDRLPWLPGAVGGAVLCDLDRDGDPDLVTGWAGEHQGNGPYTAVNDGFGRFRNLERTVIPPSYQWQLNYGCGDLNLDGFNDVIISNEATETPIGERVQIFFNNGDMTFRDVTAEVLPPVAVLDDRIAMHPKQSVIDLNGDGWLDLIPEARPPTILWNTGGNFESAPFGPGGYGGNHSWVIADFDTDGRPDFYYDIGNGHTGFLWNR